MDAPPLLVMQWAVAETLTRTFIWVLSLHLLIVQWLAAVNPVETSYSPACSAPAKSIKYPAR
jgi:hypothetical protein